jgi:hypothetical protein
VNFFAHAAVAARESDDPAFVLGAMLPDLAGMLGLPPLAASAAVEAGVAHHHAVDAAFHESAAFCVIWRRATAALRARALPRGPARGGAHVAIELFLDGALLDDAAARRAYRAALAWAEAGPRAPADAAAAREAARWAAAWPRLRRSDAPWRYGEPEFVLARVRGALAHRPLLALAPGDVLRLADALPEIQALVREEAGALFAAGAAGARRAERPATPGATG